MVRVLLILFIIFAQTSFASEILFEGYYRVELENQPIGYYIERIEVDAKKKTAKASSFLKTGPAGGDIQETIKAEAKANDHAEFEPISFSYTGQTGQTLKSIDGKFGKKGTMDIVRIEGKQVKNEKYKIPPDTFLSSFMRFNLLSRGMKVGKSIKYSAVAEEEGNSYAGSADIIAEEKFAGKNVFRIVNTFRGNEFVSFVTPSGDVLGVVSEKNKLSQVLVANPAEATKGFPVPNKSIVLTFGNIPEGKIHALAKDKDK